MPTFRLVIEIDAPHVRRANDIASEICRRAPSLGWTEIEKRERQPRTLHPREELRVCEAQLYDGDTPVGEVHRWYPR